MNTLSTKSALVTGANGFIGSHLLSALEQDGWKVAALVRKGRIDQSGFEQPKSTKIVAYDGLASSILAAVDEVRPSVVFHLASMASADGIAQIESMMAANLLLGTQLLEAMKLNGCPCFINTGTFWQNAQGADFHPATLYAATKQAFEAILQYYTEAAGITSLTLKLYDTYGADDPRPKILTHLLRHLRSGEPLMMSPGEQKMDLVHVKDVCSAYLEAAQLIMSRNPASSSGGISFDKLAPGYSIATGRLFSLKEIVSLIERLSGRRLAIRWGDRPYREREIMTPWIGQRLPGWLPQISLEDGLQQIIRDICPDSVERVSAK